GVGLRILLLLALDPLHFAVEIGGLAREFFMLIPAHHLRCRPIPSPPAHLPQKCCGDDSYDYDRHDYQLTRDVHYCPPQRNAWVRTDSMKKAPAEADASEVWE